MVHPLMTACGLSSLHRYKYKKVIGKLKGGAAHRKGAGIKYIDTMKPAVMPTPTKRQLEKMTTMPVPRRTLQMRSSTCLRLYRILRWLLSIKFFFATCISCDFYATQFDF